MIMNDNSINHIEEKIVAGQVMLENGYIEEAAGHFRTLLQSRELSSEHEALIRCHLSEALEKLGLYKEQLEVLIRYKRHAKSSQVSNRIYILILMHLAAACYHNDDIPHAIALLNQVLKANEETNDDLVSANCHLELGRAYRYITEYSIARDYFMQAIAEYRNTGRWRELAHAYIHMSVININEGRLLESIRQLEQAIAIIGDHNDHYLLSEAYCNLSVVYQYFGPSTKVFDSLERFLEHAKRANNTFQLAKYYDNKAWALVWTGKWSEAETLARSAIKLLRETPKVQFLAGGVHTLAEIHILHGRLEEAELALNEARHYLPKELKARRYCDSEIEIAFGRCELAKGRFDLAIMHFERAIEMSTRLGFRLFYYEPRLQMTEALIEKGEIEKAREIIEGVKPFLQRSLCLRDWGLMMRLVARVEAVGGRVTAALHSLSQSTSAFQILNDPYCCAINQTVRAQILKKDDRDDEAISEIESALTVFEQLGAVIDERKARDYHDLIKKSVSPQNTRSNDRDADPATLNTHRTTHYQFSIVDDFIASRLVQFSFSQQLLLHELVSIIRERTRASAAVVVKVADGNDLLSVASMGLSEAEINQKVEFLKHLAPEDYEGCLIYPFTDNHQSNYLLHIVDSKSERLNAAQINLKPLLSIVEQGLEMLLFKSKSCMAQVFDSAKFLARVEMSGFICESDAMKKVLERIHKIRSSNVTVLITGESGTGKELIARAIHKESERRDSEFLPFNCSAAPRDIIESQLFGHRKGAFTGANTDYSGVIRSAEPGTLFLDEIGDLPIEHQPKLLRFLQESEIQPLGQSKPVTVDVRVIAATNSNLEEAVAGGRFREDLFYRLNVIRICVPPLRERREDISALISYYFNQYEQEAGKIGIELSEEVVDLLMIYDWPGNVRQLCNELRRLLAYSESETVITVESLSPEIAAGAQSAQSRSVESRKPAQSSAIVSVKGTLPEASENLERQMIRAAMQCSSGNVTHAAKELGLSRAGLYLKMKRLNFKP